MSSASTHSEDDGLTNRDHTEEKLNEMRAKLEQARHQRQMLETLLLEHSNANLDSNLQEASLMEGTKAGTSVKNAIKCEVTYGPQQPCQIHHSSPSSSSSAPSCHSVKLTVRIVDIDATITTRKHSCGHRSNLTLVYGVGTPSPSQHLLFHRKSVLDTLVKDYQAHKDATLAEFISFLRLLA